MHTHEVFNHIQTQMLTLSAHRRATREIKEEQWDEILWDNASQIKLMIGLDCRCWCSVVPSTVSGQGWVCETQIHIQTQIYIQLLVQSSLASRASIFHYLCFSPVPRTRTRRLRNIAQNSQYGVYALCVSWLQQNRRPTLRRSQRRSTRSGLETNKCPVFTFIKINAGGLQITAHLWLSSIKRIRRNSTQRLRGSANTMAGAKSEIVELGLSGVGFHHRRQMLPWARMHCRNLQPIRTHLPGL